MANENKWTVGYISTVLGIVATLSSGIGYGVSKIATKHQVAVVRNQQSIESTEIHITLMYVKYDNQPVAQWSPGDQQKYEGLVQSLNDLKKERRELSGIPVGLPD